MLAVESEIVKIDVSLTKHRKGANTVDTPERAGVVWRIVEDAARCLGRPSGEGVNLPRTLVRSDSCSVETLAHVWAFPEGDQARASERHLLPSEAQRQRIVSRAPQSRIDECLMNVELIFIGGPRATSSIHFNPAFELHE